jgi:5-formyltetrahydrofolate cyclo-ligase
MSGSKKKQLRRQLLARRESLSAAEWQTHSLAICQNLLPFIRQRSPRAIFTYCHHRSEVDLSPLTEMYATQWGVPRCVGKELQWHHLSPDYPLIPGKFGILEPVAASPPMTPSHGDILLIPAVGMDGDGYRLGYGGGYYDRLLCQPQWQDVTTIGVCFFFALVPTLPRQSWDIPLQFCCTERSIATGGIEHRL